jgi:hypothetical protein
VSFRQLFVATGRIKTEKGKPVAAAASNGGSVGVFITPKSLTTFPIASFVVTLVGLFMKTLFPAWGSSVWVPTISSVFVGSVILVASTSEPNLKPRTWQGWFLAVCVALINSLYLAVSALGLLNQVGRR